MAFSYFVGSNLFRRNPKTEGLYSNNSFNLCSHVLDYYLSDLTSGSLDNDNTSAINFSIQNNVMKFKKNLQKIDCK